jgi:L-ascorbate metabolism protein UlaG (beta-lactamase superfamily)
MMHNLLCTSALVLLFCLPMSAARGAQVKSLSGDKIATSNGVLVIHPINHATLLMQWNGKTIYIDPVGGEKPFADLPKPDLVLVTHIHSDHFDPATLAAILPTGVQPTIIAPATVVEKIPQTLRDKTKVKTMANGDKTDVEGIAIEAVPAHNTTPERLKFHPKGRDNGYVLTIGGKKIYIAGDTEDTAEMRALKGIDVAFLPMNLPYTMTASQAADAIRQFKPKIVYPYHYRGGDAAKDNFAELKKLVGTDSGVEIRTPNWYP